MNDLETLYRLTQRTRAGVLNWLESLPVGVFAQTRDDFAYGSLREIYAHVAGCYGHWVSAVGFAETMPEPQVHSVTDLRAAFLKVDTLLMRAFDQWDDWDEPFVYTSRRGSTDTLTRRWLILHPVTHEFHHKGQALALARVIGHAHPGHPDTDLVTPLEPPAKN